jgi:putative transcription factor
MDCDICGKNEAVFYIEIEGAKLSACPSCSHGAKVLGRVSAVVDNATGVQAPVVEFKEKDTEIEEDYGRIIKGAREAKGIGLKEFAMSINENENYLKHVEQEKIMPTLKTAKKLEKALGIKIVNEVTRTVSEPGAAVKKQENFSMGDLMDKGEV